jgi:hypothetical protein
VPAGNYIMVNFPFETIAAEACYMLFNQTGTWEDATCQKYTPTGATSVIELECMCAGGGGSGICLFV